MQPVESTTKDGVTVVTPAGVIDTRTAQAFEATLVQAFAGGSRAFAVDFTRVDLITSAGIRVLVMMGHRLRGSGRLVLFGVGERVRTVFEIGGLLKQFQMVATQQDALGLLAAPLAAAPAAAPVPSRLSGAVLDAVSGALLGRAAARPGAARPRSAGRSALATAVLDLTRRATADPPGRPPDPPLT